MENILPTISMLLVLFVLGAVVLRMYQKSDE